MKLLNWDRWQLAAKFVLVTVLLMTILGVILSVLFVTNERRSFRAELEHNAVTLLDSLSFAVDNDLVLLDVATMQTLADELAPSGAVIRFYDDSGRLIASNAENEGSLFSFDGDPAGLALLATDQTQLEWGSDALIAGQAVVIGTQKVGAVSVELSTQPLQEKIVATTVQTAITLALMLAVAVLVSVGLARTITRPLRALVSATQLVAQGTYENKIDVHGTGEINELVIAFDDLINNTIEQRTHEIAEVAQRAQETNRLKDEFIAVMSHELRTPLNAIIGFLGIVQKKADLDEKNAHRVSRARTNAERLLALINDILDLSRIEAGRVEIIEKPLDVTTYFDKIESQVISLAEQKSLRFEIAVAPDMPPVVMADEDHLTKIVINLLGNAFKFTDEGSVTLRVRPEADQWAISVQDSGEGIPYHMQEVIFERFRQVDSSATREHGGTGLGLSIVNSLCKEMGGTIRLESKPGEGSTFTVRLPLKIAQSSRQALPA